MKKTGTDLYERTKYIDALCFLEDFESIDTTYVKKLSNKELIDRCRSASIVCGWGNLAELMKRFSKAVIK